MIFRQVHVFCRENAVECVEESSADQTIPYTNAEPETPSKCFGDESLDRSMFEDGDFTVFGTSTPLRDDEGFHYFSRFASTVGTYYADLDCIPEQANGPLESSLCDLRSGLPDPGVPFLRPYLPISKMVDAVSSKPLSELDNIIAVNKEVARTMHSKDLTTVHHFSRDTNKLKPFRPPVKRLKPFSRRWLQITFGETDHQVEMTRLAHSFLRSVETTEENVDVSE
ncbi:hypothetical protein AB6A40_009823 [Gnathostoma spinigerum]|uniref:Uncharacterized protein n=1 Tax=Gnathostoma spinigerum TaxID=75299 RepID=A0ABD6ET16_9BILA